MNSFLFSACLTLCLAAGALAQYSQGPSYGQPQGYQAQRKLAPTPQTYNQQPQQYQPQQQQQQQQYQQQQQQQQQLYNLAEILQGFEQPISGGSQYEQSAYNKAAVSPHEERAPTQSYGKPAASSYAKQQAQPQPPQQQYQAASSYAKPAPKYEEPYYPPMPFAWGYDINDGYGGAQYHKENGDENGKRTGSYGYTDAYGIYRQVDYVADETGFHATIKTNEPGTANESPANVQVQAYEPPSNYYASQSASSGYGGKQQQVESSSYQAPAAAPIAPMKPAAAYSAPAAPVAYAKQRQSGYLSPKASASGAAYQQRAPQPQQSYPEQYMSSVQVPVYQKATAAVKPAKRY